MAITLSFCNLLLPNLVGGLQQQKLNDVRLFAIPGESKKCTRCPILEIQLFSERKFCHLNFAPKFIDFDFDLMQLMEF